VPFADEFTSALEEAGLVPPECIVADGKIRRCDVQGKKGKRGGSYQLFPDLLGGGYQNWAAGGWIKWRAKRDQLSPGERKRMSALVSQGIAEREAERAALALAASLKAAEMWGGAEEMPHPYLDRKCVCSNGTRVLGDLLLIPVRDGTGKLCSLQCITADGTKRFLKGGQIEGCFTWIRRGQETTPRVYLCEGLATGTTIHAATRGQPVAVAFSCGNLIPVARLLRRMLPGGRFTICADNDHRTDGNPGIRHATAAAIDIHARLAIPRGMNGTDFNDLMIEHGIEWVSEQLKHATIPQR
jgi:putative DNA primase/helicase